MGQRPSEDSRREPLLVGTPPFARREVHVHSLLELMGRYSKSTLVNVALGELLQRARDGKLPGLGSQRDSRQH